MSTYGIKETKDALKFVLSLTNNLDKALQDGSISMTEWLSFTNSVVSLPAAINGAQDIPKELLDLDQEERVELTQFIKDELDLTDDVTEERVEIILEKALVVVVAVLEAVEALNKAKEAQEE